MEVNEGQLLPCLRVLVRGREGIEASNQHLVIVVPPFLSQLMDMMLVCCSKFPMQTTGLAKYSKS